jgi:hypothetical protein
MEMSRRQLRGRINLSRLSVLRHAPLRMETYTTALARRSVLVNRDWVNRLALARDL